MFLLLRNSKKAESKSVLKLINELINKGMVEQIKIYQDYINNIWNWKCCLCMNNFNINEQFACMYGMQKTIQK